MGGRVAEELSEQIVTTHNRNGVLPISDIHLVYGYENVTSGASSDIRAATRTAEAMVKVNPVIINFHIPQSLILLWSYSPHIEMGFLPNRPCIPRRPRYIYQPKTKGTNRGRSFKVRRFCRKPLRLLSSIFMVSVYWLIPPHSNQCRLIRGGETRAMSLLSEKLGELHLVGVV